MLSLLTRCVTLTDEVGLHGKESNGDEVLLLPLDLDFTWTSHGDDL